MPPSTTQDSKRRRLGNVFGGKKEKEDTRKSKPAPREEPSTQSGPTDSGYGSSNGTMTSTNCDTVPYENHGQVSGVGEERNLAVKKSTGEVIDEETGKVVSTVTTTTTTTTTTTRRSRPATPNNESGAEGASAAPPNLPNQPQPQQQFLSPEAAANPAPPRPPAQQVPPEFQHLQDPVGNPNNASRESTEPRQNFSYLSRSPVQNEGQMGGGAPPMPNRNSALGNLKAAAGGLYDVGETLRGTVSNEGGSRYPRRNSKKVSAADLKNQANTPNSDGLRRSPAHRTPERKTPERQWNASGAERMDVDGGRAQSHAPPDPVYHPQSQGAGRRTSMSHLPASFSPESTGAGLESNVSGLKRLMKRKSPGPA